MASWILVTATNFQERLLHGGCIIMTASVSFRSRQKLLNHIAVRTRQSHKPTNPQLQEIRVRSSMWVCEFLLNDVGFCVYQFLNPHRNSQTHVINPQTHRTHATHATHKPTRFSDTLFLATKSHAQTIRYLAILFQLLKTPCS